MALSVATLKEMEDEEMEEDNVRDVANACVLVVVMPNIIAVATRTNGDIGPPRRRRGSSTILCNDFPLASCK
jgi:hypothetical protein